ncbi:MAG: hypothetical protein Q8R91_04295, partial [Candidatus Omnitrophota bacterium]|nr:hypothetical protein [Candidatus Omnitrophota bacterium]
MAVATARQSKLDEIAQSILAIETQARTDFLWAAAHLLMIKDKDAALVPLRLNFPQVYLYKKYLLPAWQRGEPLALLCLKARREGISTFFQGWFFHKLRWIPGQNILVAAHRDDTVDELHQMVQRFHQNLPPEMRPPTKRQSRKELAYLPPLDGNMRVLPAVHMDIARGKTIQHCLLSEAAFYPDLELILAGIAEAVPDRGRSSIVIETTAEGASGGFYEMWENLGKKREIFAGARNWRRAFLPWFIHPDHELSVPRGWEPTTEELEMQKRFNLRLGQLVWYRMKLQEMELKHPGRGKRKMRSEYPSTAIEAFQMAGEGIFPEDAMTAQEAYTRPPKIGFDLVRIDAWRFGLKPQHPGQAQFQIWELPQGQAQYTIGVDVATGIGRDESAVVVIRMPGFVQVAQWHDNHTPSSDVAGIVAAIAKFYAQCGNQPIVNTEITGYGLDVVSRLSDFYAHEPFIQYIWESFDRLAAKPVGPAS